MVCLIVFRSVTYAQNAQNYLNRRRISSTLTRPPTGLAGGGCSYGLKVREEQLKAAMQVLAASPVPYGAAFCQETNGWQEVAL